MAEIRLPAFCLVVLIGPSGAGKSSFARQHFLPTETVSSDACRGLVADDENDQAASADAFDLLHYLIGKRLARKRLTVVDATNVTPEARKPLVALARQHHCQPVAVVFDLPERLCHERNQARPERQFGPHVVHRQREQLRRALRGLAREGFRQVVTFRTVEDVDAATIVREPLRCDRTFDHGPFDIIGDVHGCFDELIELLERLGYERVEPLSENASAVVPATEVAPGTSEARRSALRELGPADGSIRSPGAALSPQTPWQRDPDAADALLCTPVYRHPEGRTAIFLGDLVDRGPRSLDVLFLARAMVEAGAALALPGNHDDKFKRKLQGRAVQVAHGLAETLAELEALPEARRGAVATAALTFIDGLPSHYVLDAGKLVVAHAGMRADLQGRSSGRVRDFALYGETTGETDEFGLPLRYAWATDYRGQALVVYGHTPTPAPEWLNGTIDIDTGCVFGGRLSALRYPEQELVSVLARRVYVEPARPLAPPEPEQPALSAQQEQDDLLDLDDVIGKRAVETRLLGRVSIPEGQALAALEVLSRFAADPKWLIYLPPTMSPPETAALPDLLEHPAETFAYYRAMGGGTVVCEAKHMGSRAVVIVCRDAEAARRRFGVTTGEAGIVYTRTGRRFFDDPATEIALLERVRSAIDTAGLWAEFATDWLCLDCELLPWSAKAQQLLRQQYAPVGVAGRAALGQAMAALGAARERGADTAALYDRARERLDLLGRYVESYRRYCWPVDSVADLKLAPFHLLATEGAVHSDKEHGWHLATLARLAAADGELIMATANQIVDLADPVSEAAGVAWWEALTAAGGEGMVVKPAAFVPRGARGVIQPALKCRGREYLRLIYGPEYTLPEHLTRLRERGLGRKRALALREFVLGLEALERFVGREPLRRVHECVFAVLALESEPVDPRL